MNNTPNRAVIFATTPQRNRGRHRHPAGPWAQQNQQQQQMQNFMLSSPGAPTGSTMFTPNGHAYNMTAHSFEIPMVISTSTTVDTSRLPSSTAASSTDTAQQRQQQQQSAATNDGEPVQIVILPQMRSVCFSYYVHWIHVECYSKSSSLTNSAWCFTKW